MTITHFSNAHIFDGETPDLKTDCYVEVSDNKITYIGKEKPDSRCDQAFDLKGSTIMPGLIDAHFHAYASDADFSKLEALPKSYMAHQGAKLLRGALERGFTSVRDVGGADYGLWRATEEGLIPSPRLFYGGRALSQTGEHADIRGAHIEPCACSNMPGNIGAVVDGIDNLRKEVREMLRQGAHHIKVMVSGGISSPSDPVWMLQYAKEELEVVVEEAKRKRRYVAAHAYTAESIPVSYTHLTLPTNREV